MKFASVSIWAIAAAVVVPTRATQDDLLFHTVIHNDKEDPFAACEDFADLIGAELSVLYHHSPSGASTTTTADKKDGLERRFLRMVWPPRHPPKDDKEDVWPPRKNNTKPVGWPPSKNDTKPICVGSDCAPKDPPRWCRAFCKASYPGTCGRTFPQCVNHHHGPDDRQLQRVSGHPLAWCRYNCKGFYPGNCHVAYPWCKGMRRQLEETAADNDNDTLKEEEEEDGAPFPPLTPQDPTSLECVTLQRAVQDKLAELATMVVQDNEACAAALLEQYETKCFRVVAVPNI